MNRWKALCLQVLSDCPAVNRCFNLLLAAALLGLSMPAFLSVHADVQPNAGGDALIPFEQQFFNASYASEPLPQRLSRLENTVFGVAQDGDPQTRQSHLLQVLQGMQPTQPPQQAQQAASPMRQDSPPREPDATTYPSVTALERQVFSRDFIYDDVNNRLNRLEKKVFGTTFSNLSLADRVDKLNMRVPAAVSTTYPDSAINGLPNSGEQFVGSSRDVYRKVNALEQSIFNGNVYSGLLITERLDQLEQKTFGKTYDGESIDTRVNRLMAANSSSGGTMASSYSSSRSSGGGSFHPYGYSYSAQNSGSQNLYQSPAQNAGRGQNIQIGTGFGSQSTMQTGPMQYSPELLQMLPADMRQQLMQMPMQQYSSSSVSTNSLGGFSSNQYTTGQSTSGFSAPGNGTVMIQETTQYPSYPVYTPSGRGYYYSPGVRTNTTILTPNGANSTTYMPMSLPMTGQSPGYPQQMSQPTYGGVNYQQVLNTLEMNAFGMSQASLPMSQRLSNLESKFFGQTYPTYSNTIRINNLFNAQQGIQQGQPMNPQQQANTGVLGNGVVGNIGRAVGSFLFGGGGSASSPPGAP